MVAFAQPPILLQQRRRIIGSHLSPRDLDPLLRAGATSKEIVERLASVVEEAEIRQHIFLSNRAEEIRKVARAARAFVRKATQALNEPWAPEHSWIRQDIERQITRMQAFALSVGWPKANKQFLRNSDTIASFLAYLQRSTNGKKFDSQAAELLMSAFRAVGRPDVFTSEQIKKVRQRKLQKSSCLRTIPKHPFPVKRELTEIERLERKHSWLVTGVEGDLWRRK